MFVNAMWICKYSVRSYQHPLHSIFIGSVDTVAFAFCLCPTPDPGRPCTDGTLHTIFPVTIFHILHVPSFEAVHIYDRTCVIEL